MEELTQVAIVEGLDKSKEGAFGTALNKLQREIGKTTSGIPIRIEPVGVKIIDAKELIQTEAFLFFFMKRELKKYYLKLEVSVKVTVVELDKIEFKKEYRK